MGSAADSITARLEPIKAAYPDPAGTLDALVQALMAPVQVIDDVALDTVTTTAWATLRDPDETPATFLRWLAQHDGVRLLPSDDEQDQRDRVREAAGFYRGTVTAIRNEARRTLIGTQTVSVTEIIGGDQWAVSIQTSSAETPDSAVTAAAILRQKPAGLITTVDDTVGKPIIDNGSRTINAATETINNATLPNVT